MNILDCMQTKRIIKTILQIVFMVVDYPNYATKIQTRNDKTFQTQHAKIDFKEKNRIESIPQRKDFEESEISLSLRNVENG